MTIAIYPGSFDPIHYGHIDIAKRAAALFDKVLWAVYDRPLKNVMFSTAERIGFMREAAKGTPNIEVVSYDSLTVEFARRMGAKVMVRGLRMTFDFEVEYQTALNNREQAEDIETVLLFTSLKYAFVSSSTLKEVAFAGGRIDGLVPPYIESALRKRLAQLGDDRGDKIKQVSLQE
ncbi:MAG: pantetheine-phosphate adenylyltransferase [Chloroflexi bacterium]|nr:pantetheine-phosphate adenylyltransferase [Chloroflexota bacterium]